MATKTTKKAVSAEAKAEVTTAVEIAPVVEESKRVIVPKDIDPSQYVTVRNGFQGKLIYRSKKTGEMFVWDSFGDEQDMELGELKNARNSAKKFFENNWFMFDEPWIISYLGMEKFYKYSLNIDEFDDLFEKSVEEVEAIVAHLSTGQKRSVSYRARQLIADGTIDSKKMIKALEKSLGTSLVED